MGIVEKDPNDPGPNAVKEKILRLICRVISHEIKNFKCTRCGATFIEPDWSWISDPPLLPPEPENYSI